MTDKDRIKWNARYLKDLGDTDPSPILKKYWDLAACGNVLDIACGNGRNSLFLAEKGFKVDAVDISSVSTTHLAGRNPNINVICADMDNWDIQHNRYALILDVRFLDRRLFPLILNGLGPGGVLIFESFMDGKKHEYCLESNELLNAFKSLRIVYYEEKKADISEKFNQTASLVAIKTG